MELSREMSDRIREGVWELMEKIDIAEEMADADLLHDQLCDSVIDVLEADPGMVSEKPAQPIQSISRGFMRWLTNGPPKPPPNDLGYTALEVIGWVFVGLALFGTAVLIGMALHQLVTR